MDDFTNSMDNFPNITLKMLVFKFILCFCAGIIKNRQIRNGMSGYVK